MWYPFKFRGGLAYATVGGVLGDELGHASPSTWRRRRRWRLARRTDPDFLVAAVGGAQRCAVDAWCSTPDHRFASVVVRSEICADVSIWTETRVEPGGFRLVRPEPGRSSTSMAARSGGLVGWSTAVDGRTVDVLQPERLDDVELDLRLVPLHRIAAP